MKFRSSTFRLLRPCACATLPSEITRGASAASSDGSSASVSTKWPRWFTPICISNPSAVRCNGIAMTPALFSSTSMVGAWVRMASAADRTDARLVRSNSTSAWSAFRPRARTLSRAARPVCWLRQASTTRAPARASASAATRPRPLFAPVMTCVLPVWSGTSDSRKCLICRGAGMRFLDPSKLLVLAVTALSDSTGGY
ncbi:Uncharacterised protein [Mycobacteroides abscessus subsp. abscessus]|nr:Uncharacterised protein [Mycobacteroides abscessus subsp. abscessus]